MSRPRKKHMFPKGPYSGGPELSKGEEIRLVLEYQETGSEAAAEAVLRSRTPWVQSVLSNYQVPGFTDMDAVFSDVMYKVWRSLSNYDGDKSSLTTYLYLVIRNAMVDSIKAQDVQAEQFIPELVLDGNFDLTECIDNVRSAINAAPPDQMNEMARKVANMLLKGYSNTKIGEILMKSRTQVEEMVASVRQYIAWLMVKDNLSAEPIILDEDLYDLAMAHERSIADIWR